MKKYNLSYIMKRAWVIFRKKVMTFSEALRIAWHESKVKIQDKVEASKTLKEKLIEHIKLICDKMNGSNIFDYELKVMDSIGKNNRTYFKIYRTTCISGVTYFNEYDYGYFDNITEIYVPGIHNIRKEYVF